MVLLLDQFKRVSSIFHPKSATELFALRLAQKLGDAGAVEHYLDLVHRHAEAKLLHAYCRVIQQPNQGDVGRLFLHELEKSRPTGSAQSQVRLLSVRVERRAVAIAVLSGEHLEYTDARQLSSSPEKAMASAVGFIAWVLSRFTVESAALEAIPLTKDIQRRHLHVAICEVLRNHLLPLWEIQRTILLENCGQPKMKSRSELRQIATGIWPVLTSGRAMKFVQDAVILGLYVQIERLFILN